jgi:spore coat protein CotH
MTRRLSIVVAIVAALAASAGPARAQVPTPDAFFNDGVLHDLRLYVNSRDLVLLKATYTANTYYPADMVWGTTRVRNVAIRSRGSGSRNPWKLGLKIDFNRYVSGRTFVGLNALVLDNLWQDPGLIRDALAMKVFRAMGQAAPREAFCRLFINNEYQGLYAMVEPVDAKFLAGALADPSGYLFEYNWLDAFHAEYLGAAYAPYKARFSPQTRDKESDAALYAPIRDLFLEANRPMDAVWRDRVGALVDLDQLVTHVAIETFTAEIDGVVGAWGMNNFYLTRPATSLRHRFLPWDKDNAFSAIDSPIDAWLDENVLVRRALTFADLRERFDTVLVQCAALSATDDWLAREVDRIWALVAEAAHTDTKKQFSNAELDEHITFLKAFGRLRPVFVLQSLGVRAAPTP